MEEWTEKQASGNEERDLAREYNFGVASANDAWIFGSASPSGASRSLASSKVASAIRQVSQVKAETVEEWIDWMMDKQQVSRFIILSTNAELAKYPTSLVEKLKSKGAKAVIHVPSLTAGEGILQRLLIPMREAEEAKEKILITCPSGQVRTATVAALWVHHRYLVDLSSAVRQVRETASSHGRIRNPNLHELISILSPKVAESMARVDRLDSSRGEKPISRTTETAWSTPRSVSTPNQTVQQQLMSARSGSMSNRDKPVEISFLCTGGTIDKDYPRIMSGYAFEIGDPAVKAILKTIRSLNALNLSYNIVSVCRKDSQHIDDNDRAALLRECLNTEAKKIIVTHGTDTLVDTAEYLNKHLFHQGRREDKVIILTGAMRPEKFGATDAYFNVGCAIGAAWGISQPGVHIAMNGRIMNIDQGVTRDAETGWFVVKANVRT